MTHDPLPPRFVDWFSRRDWSPRRHQLAMVETARRERDALLIAPTGGGKTLAGFLPSLIELAERPPANTPPGLHTLYLSPLKALAVDVERNLMAPIREMGLGVRAESRTGDTGVARRRRQRVSPPDILLTTPEQLALFCAWEGSREYFADLKTVIVDGELMYLGSANWTGAGLGAKGAARRNFELGIVTDDGPLLDQVQAIYERIWTGGECEGCRLRAECPGPLVELSAKKPTKTKRSRRV